MAISVILEATKKPIAMTGFDVSVNNSFDGGWATDKRILTFLISPVNPIIKSLSTALSHDTCGVHYAF